MDTQPDWLDIDPAPAAKPKRTRKRTPAIEPGTRLPFEGKRAKSMAKSPFGKNRIWACDGEYVWFRPYRYVNGEKVLVANPTTFERHKQYLAQGHYVHVETQDDVEVYRVTDESPFKRQGLYLGEIPDNLLPRMVAKAACRRDWVEYVDILEELAGRLKGQLGPATGKVAYDERLQYISNLISMRGGPSPAECAAGLSMVRAKRGHGGRKVIVLPNGVAG